MLPVLVKYSGYLAIVIAWLLVVLPAFLFGIKPHKETISKLTSKYLPVKVLVSTGLLIGSIFQALFLIFLMNKYSITNLGIGGWLYLSTNLVTIFVAIFNEKDYKIIHRILVFYYFITNPLSILLLGFQLGRVYNSIIFIASLFLILYLLGNLFLFVRFKKVNAYYEIYSFILLSVWTISMINI